MPVQPYYGFREAEPVRFINLPHAGENVPLSVDPVEQNRIGAPASYTVGLNLLGVGAGFPGYNVRVAPPDTNMAVGDTQVVQWVNTAYAVFNKTTGAIIAGPIQGNQLWAGFSGTQCANNNDGDVIAQWDVQAHRWFLTQNVFHLSGGLNPPYYACVAVSTTADATDTYNRYQFNLGNGFPDYPKWGMHPLSWVETINNFGPFAGGFVGAEVCVYNRVKILAGDASAEQVCFQLSGNDYSLLPADNDSPTLSPTGQDAFIIGGLGTVDNTHLSLYSVNVNWSNPSGATITGNNNSQQITIPSFNPSCNGSYRASCVPQKGTTNRVDSLGDRLMYRFAYWDEPFPSTPPRTIQETPYQHWYVVHDVTASAGQNATRWYEFRAPQKKVAVTALSVFQSGTYAPDSNYRWMGSAAQDKVGDILVGYSESSANIYPSIYVAGRQKSDPPGTLEPEVQIQAGTGSESNGLTRWGDYSSVRIDQDGCTFWYTTEYLQTTGVFNWSTRLGSVKFANCQ